MNLCTACGQDFGGVELFDRHRVGRHAYTFSEGLEMGLEDGRRCLDPTEMEKAGWRLTARNRWTDRPATPEGVCAEPPSPGPRRETV